MSKWKAGLTTPSPMASLLASRATPGQCPKAGREETEGEAMNHLRRWLLVFMLIGLVVVLVDIVAIECGRLQRTPVPATHPSSDRP